MNRGIGLVGPGLGQSGGQRERPCDDGKYMGRVSRSHQVAPLAANPPEAEEYEGPTITSSLAATTTVPAGLWAAQILGEQVTWGRLNSR